MSDIAQRSQSTPYDVQLLFPVLFLVGIGIVMVYSSSSVFAARTYGDAEPGALLVYTGSVGFLEVAMRDGNAAERLRARAGDPVVATRRNA
jgi:S-adenosylmethionine hydrolase